MFYLNTVLWMLAWSCISLYVYWKDKRQAVNKGQRVEELTLDALALLGGWPGCIYAQYKFRHKTRSAYQRRFRAIVIAWILGYSALWYFLWVGEMI
ncbi:DUF1294 domain-containing protein [Cronobacter turicensis]